MMTVAADWPVKNREIVMNSMPVDFEKGRKSLRLREIDNIKETVMELSQKIQNPVLVERTTDEGCCEAENRNSQVNTNDSHKKVHGCF